MGLVKLSEVSDFVEGDWLQDEGDLKLLADLYNTLGVSRCTCIHVNLGAIRCQSREGLHEASKE